MRGEQNPRSSPRRLFMGCMEADSKGDREGRGEEIKILEKRKGLQSAIMVIWEDNQRRASF